MAGSLLIYLASGAIKDYCAMHPVNWSDRELACLGGPGDRAGRPPVSSVEIFLDLLRSERGLFTQERFWDGCVASWGEWLLVLPNRNRRDDPEVQRRGLQAKAYRNFYPSMIDSLHVWSMLVEVGGFDRCFLDSVEDHTGKTDLTVCEKNGTVHRIALQGRSGKSKQMRRPAARGEMAPDVHVVRMPDFAVRPRGVGNKQWFDKDDFFTTWPEWKFSPGWQQRRPD